MRDREKLARVKKLNGKASLESILTFLRQEHTSKINSIRLLHLGTGRPLGEAKKLVFQSRTWSDRYETDEKFLDSLLQELNTLEDSEAA